MFFRSLAGVFVLVAALVLLLAAERVGTESADPPEPAADTRLLPASIPTPLPELDQPDRLVDGFKAFVADDSLRTMELLDHPSSTTDALEDWRLFVYAEAAFDLEHLEASQGALEQLVENHPRSPIRSLAILRAAQHAAESQRWEAAIEWIELGRQQTMSAATAVALDVVMWEMGADLERPELQVTAGRRLLVQDPLLAEELDVYDTLRRSRGLLDLTEVLTPTELEQRASRQIENRRSSEALETLDLVPPEQRGFDWVLLRAEALTGDHRGREALEILAGMDASDPEQRLAVVYQRALAARDASKVRRGRANLSSNQREDQARQARELLRQVANETTNPELRKTALRLLFAEISDMDDSFEQAMPVLQQLKIHDPDDVAGTRYLFGLGWQAYIRRNYSGAIGYWSELEALYSGTNLARSGRYWIGRAHEAMGHADRASSIYREISDADIDDFYSRHARARLVEPSERTLPSPSQPTEPWPYDPLLDRARWLSDVGLNEFALHELDAFAEIAERRAYCAEKAVLLARLGQRRESISWLVCAFPSLGHASQGIVPRSALELYYPLDFRDIIEKRAEEQRLSPYLVFAMVRQESAFDAAAHSWAGARGLMQLMPATGQEIARRLGLRYSTARLEDPDFSVRLGTRYFRQVLDMFDGNQELALAGYNGGPYRIKKLWRQAGSNPELDHFLEGLTLEETKTYVKRILLFEDTYHKLYTSGS